MTEITKENRPAAEADPNEPPTVLALLKQDIEQLGAWDEMVVPELTDRILNAARELRASDIHLEARPDHYLIRYRIDGQLIPVARLSRKRGENVIARLKMLAKVLTYRKRLPQDGRLGNDDGLALRAAFMPTLHGEKAVLRLPTQIAPRRLEELGLSAADFGRLQRALLRSHGVILFTGPCSSGKSTSIYAALRFLLDRSPLIPNIATLEDPIEQEIDGVNQTQIDPAGGLSFLTGLRTLLRMDPDVIVVGEIRDEETAATVLQAGLSGHLVLSTIHSGTTAQVYARLLHMGIEPFLLAGAISAVVAQRLARQLCAECKRPISARGTESLWAGEGLPIPANLYEVGGCPACSETGYRGRRAIFEVSVPDDPLREAIVRKAPTAELRQLVLASGTTSLWKAALQCVAAGYITLAEARRILGEV